MSKTSKIAEYLAYMFTYGRRIGRRRLRRRLQSRPNHCYGLIRSATGRTAAYHVGCRRRHLFLFPHHTCRRVATLSCEYWYSKADINILQGSVAKGLRSGWFFNDHFVVSLLPNVSKNFDIGQYLMQLRQNLLSLRFRSPCITGLQLLLLQNYRIISSW